MVYELEHKINIIRNPTKDLCGTSPLRPKSHMLVLPRTPGPLNGRGDAGDLSMDDTCIVCSRK